MILMIAILDYSFSSDMMLWIRIRIVITSYFFERFIDFLIRGSTSLISPLVM